MSDGGIDRGVFDDIQMAGLTEAELEELSEFMDPDVRWCEI